MTTNPEPQRKAKARPRPTTETGARDEATAGTTGGATGTSQQTRRSDRLRGERYSLRATPTDDATTTNPLAAHQDAARQDTAHQDTPSAPPSLMSTPLARIATHLEHTLKLPTALDVSRAQTLPPATPLAQARAADVTPHLLNVLGELEGLASSVVANVGSFAFTALQSVESVVTGPPVVPPGSHVTVQTSTIQLDNGDTVPANWYYPTTADGTPPKQMILLQHGFLAQGPMYSYTAAALAENTGSIVVTPTLSSNPFAGDDHWLGGTGMAASVGRLFEGDRTALTQSALDAGYAEVYGLDPATAQLPKPFALVGHSLGANLVSGAAGTLADDCTAGDCAADDLVGAILLDGVPMGNTVPNALDALDAKEALTGYIPVREIGAPLNAWNSLSSVNEQLTAARPDRFNGVVLTGGVHSDSMSGGNPLIQFALYVAAGFPQPQNPPAVEELSSQWLNEWFAGDTDEGDGTAPGTTIAIDTPDGTAHGTVIGTPPPPLIALFHDLVIALEGAAAGSIPSVHPTLLAV